MKASTVIIERGLPDGVFTCPDPLLTSRFIASAHLHFFNPCAKDFDERKMIVTLYGLDCDLERAPLAPGSERRNP